MSEYRKRRRIRKKEAKKLEEEMIEATSASPFSYRDEVDVAEMGNLGLIFSNGVVVGLIIDGTPFPSLRGILMKNPERRHVTVDMGAVKFLYNGADVMAPGIVDADTDIEKGDIVWVREEKHGRPLIVGKALMSGSDMIELKSGKAIKTIHYVGDKIWKIDE